MKKVLLLWLFSSSLLFSQILDYDYEITPLVGYNISEANQNLPNQTLTGAEFQLDNIGMPVNYEFSILHTSTDFHPNYGSTNITRIAQSGVYYYKKRSRFTPFVKMGLGYETMSRQYRAYTGDRDSVFFDASTGTKIALVKHISLKLEILYMQKLNAYRYDNNIAFLAGLNFAFGDARSIELRKDENKQITIDEDSK